MSKTLTNGELLSNNSYSIKGLTVDIPFSDDGYFECEKCNEEIKFKHAFTARVKKTRDGQIIDSISCFQEKCQQPPKRKGEWIAGIRIKKGNHLLNATVTPK